MTSLHPTRILLAVVLGCSGAIGGAMGGCEASSEPQADDLGFPLDEGPAGKADALSDAFGRSLAGPPDPYRPAGESGLEERLAGDLRARRQFGWEVAQRVLEPVPLVGLAEQVLRRPACPDDVEVRSLRACRQAKDEDACEAFPIDGEVGLCAWTAFETCDAACDDLVLPEDQPVPEVARFQTWYGVEDLDRIFGHAFGRLDPAERLSRAPLTDAQIAEAMRADHAFQDRVLQWPIERYTKVVDDLFDCDLARGEGESDEDFGRRCALDRQAALAGAATPGGGIARILYSPAMAVHMMRNYAEVLDCADEVRPDSWCEAGEPCEEPPENFSTCFRGEFPRDLAPEGEDGFGDAGGSAVIKATWSRVGFGFDLPAYDTDAEALAARVGPGQAANWDDGADRTYPAPPSGEELTTFPTPDDIFTIRTRGGALYRLTGLHVATKELRHWVWVSLWWSDRPDDDFGEDRPESFGDLDPVWSNYKMCVAVDYFESDVQAAARFDDLPSLQAALSVDTGAPTWCSNPYIEHGEGNARTNCIGCHQHAGTRVDERGHEFRVESLLDDPGLELTETNRYPANGRTRRRRAFATDYSWAFSRIDDLTSLLQRQVGKQVGDDPLVGRMTAILAGPGDVEAGREIFVNGADGQACSDCHGAHGEGGFGPDLHQRFAQANDWTLLHTIMTGRSIMPAWSDHLDDTQLTDLFAYLRSEFEAP